MALLLANTSAIWMFVAGCALLTWVLLKRSYRYFGSRSRRENSRPLERLPRPASTWDGAQRDSLAQVERQKVEMHEMARDINGQLSSKIIILEQLISDSQRQIDRLVDLLQQAEQTGPAATTAAGADSM